MWHEWQMRFAARPNAGERSCFLKQDYFPICKERGVKDLRFNALAAPSFLSIESCRSTSFQQHIRWMLSGASIRSQPQHLHSDADHPSILPLRDTHGERKEKSALSLPPTAVPWSEHIPPEIPLSFIHSYKKGIKFNCHWRWSHQPTNAARSQDKGDLGVFPSPENKH